MTCNGQALWPHEYQSADGPMIHPPTSHRTQAGYRLSETGPSWSWEQSEGTLEFSVAAREAGGIALSWRWDARTGTSGPARLSLRPICAMRGLHGLGGQSWIADAACEPGTLVWRESKRGLEPLFVRMHGPLRWRMEPSWYYGFRYPEEEARGYACTEDLFSAGVYEGLLEPGQSATLHMAAAAAELSADQAATTRIRRLEPLLDFALIHPAGVVAGYPWFGEWGRDTFISLPGIVAGWRRRGGFAHEVFGWARAVLSRWGEWVFREGMIPNFLDTGRVPQWEAADSTLWLCHALAALWSFSLSDPEARPGDLSDEFLPLLDRALHAIHTGSHRFLRVNSEGLLEVTSPHATWMDARVEGRAVTPRTGALPEINALWFQAHFLKWLWSEQRPEEMAGLEALGQKALERCSPEPGRPNRVFLHSIPLAPSFILNRRDSRDQDLRELEAGLLTPAGVRTLAPGFPGYRARCEGRPEQRDRVYHQGPVWGWLGGHYDMAKNRSAKNHRAEEFVELISGHAPELLDAEPPFTPRGTPAQAWSLATREEALGRERLGTDRKLTEILSRRWLGREGRRARP